MQEEIWKDIEGYEGLYQVSNQGRIKGCPIITKFGARLKKYDERLLKPAVGKRGYCVVSLSKNGKMITKTIHRLVAQAFIPNPNNYPCIDHIDTNKLNNRSTNLRWCTHKGNSANPLSLRRQSETTKKMWQQGVFDKRNNLNYRKVAQLSKHGVLIKVWDSIIEASRELSICASSITCVCNKRNPKRHSAGGFVWKYIGGKYMK